jgi:hypothetical protein
MTEYQQLERKVDAFHTQMAELDHVGKRLPPAEMQEYMRTVQRLENLCSQFRAQDLADQYNLYWS